MSSVDNWKNEKKKKKKRSFSGKTSDMDNFVNYNGNTIRRNEIERKFESLALALME